MRKRLGTAVMVDREAFEKFLESRHMTVGSLASRCGMTGRTVRKYKNGGRSIDMGTAMSMCLEMHCTLEEMFGKQTDFLYSTVLSTVFGDDPERVSSV